MSPREIVVGLLVGLAAIAGLVGFTKLPGPHEPAPQVKAAVTGEQQAQASITACRQWFVAAHLDEVPDLAGEIRSTALADVTRLGAGPDLEVEAAAPGWQEQLDKLTTTTALAASTPLVAPDVFDALKSVTDTAHRLSVALDFADGIDPTVLEDLAELANNLSSVSAEAQSTCLSLAS
jgi:hypothetical protein